MGLCRWTYPSGCLDAIKKGIQNKKALSAAIENVLQNDAAVQTLIKTNTGVDPPYEFLKLRTVLGDQGVRDLIVQKTWNTYYDLVKRSERL
jgi:hypothetical protein